MADKPAQLDLFDDAKADVGDDASASWTATHWPDYAGGKRKRPPAASAFVLWAEAHSGLPITSREILIHLATRADRDGTCRTCIRSIAEARGGLSRNTVKRHLQHLLDAGLVLLRPWTESEEWAIGYSFRLVVDDDARAAALADGFLAERSAPRVRKSGS